MMQDSYAATVDGVTLNITPLLMLNADQHTKLSEEHCSRQVVSVPLDVYWAPSQQSAIVQLILNASSATLPVIFASPQA